MSNDSSKRGDPSGQARSLVAAHARLVNAESFSDGQRRCVARYLELSHSSGVLVGAHAGTAAWDMRPLVLEDGKLNIIRFSDPGLSLEQPRLNWLRNQFQRRLSWGPRPNILGMGEEGGQVWIKRRYYHQVIDRPENISVGGSLDRAQFLQAILLQVRTLHRNGLMHGHITFGNMAYEDNAPLLLDPCLRVVLTNPDGSPFLAPEIPGEFPPLAATDLYGVGVVATHLWQGAVPQQLKVLVDKLLDRNYKNRPTLEAIEDVVNRLATTGTGQPASQGTPSPGGAPHVPGGKRISATLSPPPTPSSFHSPKKVQQPPERIARELKQTVIVPRDLIAEIRKDQGIESPPPPAAEKSPPVAKTETPEPKAPEVAPPEVEVAPAPRPPVADRESQSSSVTTKSNGSPILLFAIVILVAAVVVVRLFNIQDLFAGKQYDIAFEEYWKSGQRSLMEQVVEAAVEGKVETAQITIVKDILQGANPPMTRAGIIRFTFDPRWEQQLTPQDRDAAFRIAFAALYPAGMTGVQDLPLDKLNPIVHVAVIGDLGIDKDLGVWAKLPIDILEKLPSPLKESFSVLADGGARTLGDPDVRALAHLVLGDTTDKTFNAFFSSNDPRSRLRLLLPFTGREEFDNALLNYLSNGQTLLADYVKWMGGDEFAQWENVSARIRLGLVLGDVPTAGLTLEQYADLLQFPDEAVRQVAVVSLVRNFLGREAGITLKFLASERNLLGRFQTVALVSSFKLDPDAFFVFLKKWFEANPDTSTIIGLLIARSDIEGVDALNFQAASYLKKANWDATLSDLTTLSHHPEALARALAYSKLDPGKENERALLEEALKNEPNKSFRDELARRLKQ